MGEADIKKDFFHHVNLTLKELEAWLDSETSMNTGLAAEDGEPKGHKSGRQIVDILKKGKDASFTEDETTHMKHVNAYCKRHLKQGNSKDPEHSKWRYSLMNWGCDPLKKPFGDSTTSEMPGKQGSKSEGTKSPEKKSEAAKSPEKTKASSPKKGSTEKAKAASPEKTKAASPEKTKAASPEKKQPSSPTKRKDEGKSENGKAAEAKKQKTDA